MSYRIKIDIEGAAVRQAIDAAVHMAISRFEREFAGDCGLAHRVAGEAAAIAMEHFKAWCNAELRLIQIEHERKADLMALSIYPPAFKEVGP